MSLNGTLKYIDLIPEILVKYNSSRHRTIGMTPNEASKKKNEKMLLETVYTYSRPVVKPRFKIGDYVRVSKPKYIFSRGFYPSWSNELFRYLFFVFIIPCLIILFQHSYN